MVKKYFVVVLVIIITILVFKKTQGNFYTQAVPITSPSSMPASPSSVHVHAKFAVITNGTTRVFTDKKYHNLSPDVHLEAEDPNTVHVHKEGIIWSDFFTTLPMSLSKTCLVTGTNQTFCTGNDKALKFYINGQENPNALDTVIGQSDKLVVEFK